MKSLEVYTQLDAGRRKYSDLSSLYFSSARIFFCTWKYVGEKNYVNHLFVMFELIFFTCDLKSFLSTFYRFQWNVKQIFFTDKIR